MDVDLDSAQCRQHPQILRANPMPSFEETLASADIQSGLADVCTGGHCLKSGDRLGHLPAFTAPLLADKLDRQDCIHTRWNGCAGHDAHGRARLDGTGVLSARAHITNHAQLDR
jgi:hypothetical protein